MPFKRAASKGIIHLPLRTYGYSSSAKDSMDNCGAETTDVSSALKTTASGSLNWGAVQRIGAARKNED